MNKYTPRIMRHRRGNMNETEWDIQEVKRLKWKQLVQYNVLMLLLFSFYYLWAGNSFFLCWSLLCLALWVFVAHSLYTFFTGKMIGTKTMKLVQSFYKNYLVEKHWNKRKLIGFITISVVRLLFMFREFILRFLKFIVLGPMGYSCTQSLYFFYRENDRNKNNEACASF